MKVASVLGNARNVGVVLGAMVVAVVGMQGSAQAAIGATPMVAAAAAAPAPRLTRLVADAVYQTTLGISYLYGGGHGTSPAPVNSHVDCSGFVREMYHYAFGIDIGSGSGDGMIRQSGLFTRTGRPVPGDVVLLGSGGAAPAYHAGIYIGTGSGEPAMVGSPESGQNIKVQPSRGGSWGGDLMGYWHFNGATAADSAAPTAPAAAPAPRQRGSFDAAAARLGSVSAAGWAVDPQRPTGAALAQILLDGRQVAVVGTSVVRADVNRALGIGGAHGFGVTVGADPGRHTICVNARPSGTSSVAVSLGCRTVIVPATPTRGSFDTLTMTPSTFAATGWAYDVRAPAAGTVVRITSDGRLVALVNTSVVRNDVNRVFGIVGAHGFSVRVAAARGRHTVCAVALPAVASSAASNVGCKSIVTG